MEKLEKELTLFDVYAISTGAMFSSGFFLLPGIAAARTGPSVVLAYLASGALAVPAMFSLAELSTAMPRAGGTYYFLDRSLGPLAGTMAGFGTWLALIFKSAFALVGMGAYLAVFFELPVRPVALGFTGLFVGLNLFGARETGGLQRALVVILLGILLLFLVQGLGPAASRGGGIRQVLRFTGGTEGFFATVGLVFVSFAGLLKVASVPEEVHDPDRNIPLGMFLSLATAAVVYGLGIFILVAVLEPAALSEDLTPIASAAERTFTWLPGRLGVGLIVAAAVAAFAAMANAGVLSASRYPLAMARDRIVPSRLREVGRFGTPTAAILVTGGLMAFALLALDVEGIAKLASSLLLLVFGFVNLSVIVMRESRIAEYDPGFTSPGYPWLQILGFLMPLLLIAEMGWMSILFTTAVIGLSLGWYHSYARPRVTRDGAMFHVFERLGRRRFSGLEPEMRQILKEKGLRKEDPFEQLVAEAPVIDRAGRTTFEEIADEAAREIASMVPVTAEELRTGFLEGTRVGATPVSHGVALPHVRLHGLARPHLVLARVRAGIGLGERSEGERQSGTEARAEGGREPGASGRTSGATSGETERGATEPVRAVFFLMSSEADASQHLRLLAQLAGRADDEDFMELWLNASNELELKEAVLRSERYLSLRLSGEGPTRELVGRRLGEIRMPEGSLVALVHREGEVLVPRGGTELCEGDRLTIIGQPGTIRDLERRWAEDRPDGG